MINELVAFYKIVANNEKLKNLVTNTDDISWIDIYDDEINDLHMGISQDGIWILKYRKNIYMLDDDKKFLYCSDMLEVPYEKIKTKLQDRFKDVLKRNKINIITIFPFYQIVEFSLNNLIDDYWFELAMLWFEELDSSARGGLKDSLKKILGLKKISQKNRQRVGREIKKLESET